MRRGPDIWIQGGGELASAVGVALVEAGCRVVLAEVPRPLAVRRLACFAEAVYAGRATVAGVPGRLAPAPGAAFADGEATIVVDPEAEALVRVRPSAIVDARMTKRPPVPLPRASLPLIGLGPGFTCGLDADLVIETHREAGCGRVLERGGAAPDTGVPGAVGGQTAARLLRSPGAGRLRPRCAIGDLVVAGQIVGEVAGLAVTSRLDGLLRGLIHESVDLVPGLKIGDVDPRGASVDPRAVTDKGRAVGAGVVAALTRLGLLRQDPPGSG